MIFEEKTIILKDGRTAILKSPCVEDAEKLMNYIKKSCSETDFLARISRRMDNNYRARGSMGKPLALCP